jgi:hypothetical protein
MSRRRRFLRSLGILPDHGLDRPEGILVAESVANGLLEEYFRARRRWYLWCDDGDIVEIDHGGY